MMVNPNEINSFFYRLFSSSSSSIPPFSPYNSDVNQSFNPPNVPTDDVHTPRIVHTRTPSGLLLSAIFSLSLSLSRLLLFLYFPLSVGGGCTVQWVVRPSQPHLLSFSHPCVYVRVCGRSKILFERLTPSHFNFFTK
jgi:hypothetical protein